jgi:hypothetical protein
MGRNASARRLLDSRRVGGDTKPARRNFINQNFVPVKRHIKEQPALFHRFHTNWTPTIEIVDSNGVERYRFAGYLPSHNFVAQLQLGLAKNAFAHNNWPEAQRHFDAIVASYSDTDAAPEAMYWAGVTKYKQTRDHTVLAGTAKQIEGRFPRTSWAMRSSVWLPKPGEEKVA